MSREQRYLAKVDRHGDDDCWPWTAFCNPAGYGMFRGGDEQLAHRYGFRLLVGPIPDGHSVCHTCDNPPCQNPRHWFTGTHKENHEDKDRKGRGAPCPPSRGEDNSRAKLTADQVLEIRRLYSDGLGQREIGERFGIGQVAVSKIVLRQRWTHI